MLIKVKSDGERWVLFDDAERIEFGSTLRQFSSQDEIDSLSEGDSVEVTCVLTSIDLNDINEENPLEASIINFYRSRKKHLIVFNTFAYICNDQGKTIEKVDTR